MATMPKEALGDKVVQEVALSLVIPSKNNPRKSFDDDALSDLAESIKAHGVTSPILTRPVGSKFELIYGERRLRASKLAGKESIPAIILDMSDEEAEELRFVENIQREDLSAMEEAQELGKHYKAVPPAMIAAKLGKPESYVVQRLRLLKLIEDAQKALAGGKILLGHAFELCKLREDEQKQVLKWLLSARVDIEAGSGANWQEVKTHYSVEALKRFIQAHFLLILAKAPFDTTDPALNPAMGACTDCQYNTANLGMLFPGVKDARCTVPDCFQIKVNKSLLKQVAEIAKQEPEKKVVRLGIGNAHRNSGVSKNMVDLYLEPWQSHGIVEVAQGKECESVQIAVVTWIDSGSETKAALGNQVLICTDANCGTHHGSGLRGDGARPEPLKGLAKVEHKAETLKASVGQRAREEAFKQLVGKWIDSGIARGFLPKTNSGAFVALLHYVQKHLYIDRFRDAGKALGIERPEKKSEFQGPNWEGVVVKHFAGSQSALVLALVAAEGLQDADKTNALYRMAAEYRVDVDKIAKAIAKEDASEVKEMRDRAKKRAAAESKKVKEAKKAEPAEVPSSATTPKKDRKKKKK